MGDSEMNSKICQMLNIKYPILQGAMAWIADAKLAAAVSDAGGLGIIAAGNAPVDTVRAEIRKAKEQTDRSFGVNVMLLSPYVDDIVQLICDENVKVVTTGAGSPGKYMSAFKDKNIKVIPVVASVALAKRMEKTGADALIAEGMESGGHIGKLTTMALLPQVVDAVSIPVIGAGGIGDGRGMAAALMLGADGVQIGTRFLVAHECCVHSKYKAAILKAKDIDTTITGQLTGHPVRIIRNRLAREIEQAEAMAFSRGDEAMELFDNLTKGALKKAVVDGDVDYGSVMSGQIAGMVTKEESCKDIIESLMKECRKTVAAIEGIVNG